MELKLVKFAEYATQLTEMVIDYPTYSLFVFDGFNLKTSQYRNAFSGRHFQNSKSLPAFRDHFGLLPKSKSQPKPRATAKKV